MSLHTRPFTVRSFGANKANRPAPGQGAIQACRALWPILERFCYSGSEVPLSGALRDGRGLPSGGDPAEPRTAAPPFMSME
ncbi:MAG TPA: hypothetical protein PKB02_10620 [Anaerohalosphaeraceae bacterium]|nr:hypothetical protein [Anaerohalosphaeraceae bacterium]